MIDTHCHLFFDNLYNNLDEIIAKSQEAGVKYIICPSTNLETARKSLEIAERYDIVYAAVGIHPHDTSDFSDYHLRELNEMIKHKKVVAVGEIGLDYYYDYSPKEKQKAAFREQLILARENNLPVIIHNRESGADVLDILNSVENHPIAQFHCFSEDLNYARKVIAERSFISFTGNITYPKAEGLRNVLKNIELEDILLETDSPFMAPVPFRSKTNTPEYLKIIVEKIAEIKNCSIEEVIRTTAANVFRLFGIGKKPELAYTYQIGNSLYINVTNRCNADCVFCDRNGFATIKGYNLKMPKNAEPPSEIYINEIGDPKKYYEIVFCGYGEPTIRVNILKEVGKYVKEMGGKTRLNTNGHGNVINKRNILVELQGVIDTVSISLNSTDPKQYAEIMRVPENYFYEMIEFIKESKKYIPNVVISVVGMDDINIEKARKFAEDLGVEFRVRSYF